MDAVAVIEEPTAAIVALDPVRSSLLASLAKAPASAAGAAGRLGLARQKVGYHLATLEERGLVAEVERRSHGGLVERIYAATAGSFVIGPQALGAAAADPNHVADHLSASYAVAVAARVVREVGGLLRGARKANKRAATLTIDTDIRFRSAADRAAFADALAEAVRALAAQFHDERASGGRWHRLVVLAHPRPEENPE